MNPASPGNITAQQSRTLVGQLKRSEIYRDYEKAFREATGLPITLRPIEAFDLPHHGDPRESPFCALMATSNHSCSACLQTQRKVEEESRLQTNTVKCFAGLHDSAVPVRVGDNLIAFLQTGQILTSEPRKKEFARAARQLERLGVELDLKQLQAAYFQTRVVTRKQYESILRLLTIFAQHLSVLSNQLIVQGSAADAPGISQARMFIAEHFADEISLSTIARVVNMSTFYFCKTFKRTTGMTFTDYLARVRVEMVKNILLNPQKRVSEAAYAAGFQSLSQFNRAFRRVAGESPTSYRERLHGGKSHAAHEPAPRGEPVVAATPPAAVKPETAAVSSSPPASG
jgi:AraC-like DNA-binding protein/ligand-binding sensor protein